MSGAKFHICEDNDPMGDNLSYAYYAILCVRIKILSLDIVS